MNFLNLIKKIYFNQIINKLQITTNTRGRLSNDDELYFKAHPFHLDLIRLKENLDGNSRKDKVLELGFGNGHHIVSLAKQNQGKIIYGVELYKAGCFKVLKKIDLDNLNHLFVINKDARNVLKISPDNTFEKILTLFPDPWPKEKHHKRRLVNSEFISLCLSKTKEKGTNIIATDWQNYAYFIELELKYIKKFKDIQIKILKNPISTDWHDIQNSTFAKRAKKEGRSVYIFEIQKN